MQNLLFTNMFLMRQSHLDVSLGDACHLAKITRMGSNAMKSHPYIFTIFFSRFLDAVHNPFLTCSHSVQAPRQGWLGTIVPFQGWLGMIGSIPDLVPDVEPFCGILSCFHWHFYAKIPPIEMSKCDWGIKHKKQHWTVFKIRHNYCLFKLRSTNINISVNFKTQWKDISEKLKFSKNTVFL